MIPALRAPTISAMQTSRALMRAWPAAGVALTWSFELLRRAHTEAAGSKRAPYVAYPLKCEDGTTVIPWTSPSRSEQLDRLQKEDFDVLVIGGGCVGAGVMWEAATRGLKVALVERDDFAAGTSGRSTKLIHGGIRYLEAAVFNADREMLGMVQEALHERAHMLNAAPFMNAPLPIIIPIYSWWEIPYMWAGAKAYDIVAGLHSAVPASYFVSRGEALFQFPMLKADGLKGAVVYYDGQMNDSRLNVLIALTAMQKGAVGANYVEVKSITHDAGGRASGAIVRDVETGKQWPVRARAVINAGGCFGDAIRQLDDAAAEPLIQGAAGVHIVLPDHFSPDHMGLIIPKTRDGRVLFFLPWEGMTLCGTTDAPAPIDRTPAATADDVAFILEEANRYLNRKVTHADVKAAWSGIRPLVKDPSLPLSKTGTAQISRQHVVEVNPRTGLVSILGGKWTTYRAMAQDAVEAAAKSGAAAGGASSLGALPPSVTAKAQVLGADRAGVVFNKKYDRIPVTLRESFGLEKDIAHHLSRNYGTRALQVAELARRDPQLRRRLMPRHPFLAAEVVFAAEQEFAQTAVDVLARRTRLAFLDAAAAEEALPSVLDLLAGVHGWGKARREEEAARARAFLATMHDPVRHMPVAPPGPHAAAAGGGDAR